ncbi:protealysin inhibitor emfourin [Noviherbaspirillum sp. ST9]|uniref:protealysin inhibitor emfourin n=1 Tax=Noviherbaspirillum sp. ST9 TaxID=3401606 RepID=UPI003B588808
MEPLRQIIFQSDSHGVGFFPGLAKPVVIDPAALGEEDAARLQALAEDARFFELPSEVGQPRAGAADYQCDVLTIDDGTATHTVRAMMPIADPALKALLDAVRAHVKAIRAAARR